MSDKREGRRTEHTAFPQNRKVTLLSAAKELNSNRTKKWPFCVVMCGSLVAMLTEAKGSLFPGWLEQQIMGRKKVVGAAWM